MDSTTPVVLDLDGVIFKSNFIKHEAMRALFDGHPRQRGRISSYILANGGVRRDHKIRHILESILGTRPTEQLLAEHLSRYARELEYRLPVAPLVEGVDDFLANRGHTFYVSSSAPEAEVIEQLSRHKLDRRFAAVFGAGTPKTGALRQVSARHPAATAVFFGDSVGDREAAQEARVAFVAVVSERDNFAGREVAKLVDFASPAAVRASMQFALLQHATIDSGNP